MTYKEYISFLTEFYKLSKCKPIPRKAPMVTKNMRI